MFCSFYSVLHFILFPFSVLFSVRSSFIFQVKVAFGDVWKESLAELSGGQRSLVALSLILALLLFKPAPIYILDEVDAALDLSHTQNIGNMLRTHFKHSQVSLVMLDEILMRNEIILYIVMWFLSFAF